MYETSLERWIERYKWLSLLNLIWFKVTYFVSVVIFSFTITEVGGFKHKKFTDFSRNFFIIFFYDNNITDSLMGGLFSIRGMRFVNELRLQLFPPVGLWTVISLFDFYISCRFMISVLIAGIEKMNIVRMVLAAITISVLVWDLKQHSCNMASTRKIGIKGVLSGSANL